MKIRLLTGLLTFLFAFLGTERVQAQIYDVDVDSSMAFSQTYCSLPSNTSVHFGGFASGNPTPTDSLTVYINFGDGSDTTFRIPLVQNMGLYSYFYAYVPHSYTTPGTYSILYAGTADNGVTDTVYGNPMTYSTSCNNLSGDLYVDGNANCIRDVNETGLPHTGVTISGSGSIYQLYTDATGHYSVDIPAGFTYTISPATASVAVTPSCPAGNTATVTLNSATVSNFAYDCSSPNPLDFAVSGWAIVWRPNQTRVLSIAVLANNWCATQPATITATLPPALSYVSTVGGLPAPTVSGNTLTWNVSSLSYFNTFFTSLNIYCDSANVTLGDTLCVDLQIITNPADASAANNTATVCAIVSNSYDPNDKNVSPKGNGTDGAVTNGTKLTYMIRFQNTGNDVAYDVTVRDLIDGDLDLSTLHVIETSHPMNLGVSGRELSFRFENINLPDSGSNEPASHGHILYSISPKPNLPPGTVINNEAHIYFDYNPAIITNTTYNVIAAPTGVNHVSNGSMEAIVSPNPAGNQVFISVSGNGSFRAELFDMMGRLVRATAGQDGKAVLSVKEVTEGMYILRLSNTNKQILTTKLNILH